MSRRHLTDSSVAKLRPIGMRDTPVLNEWHVIDAFLRAEPGIESSTLFAEPEEVRKNIYAWFTDGSGEIVAFDNLTEDGRANLLEKAERQRKAIDGLSRAMLASSTPERKLLGTLLQKALTIPSGKLSEILFSVGDEPVLIHWGMRLSGQDEGYSPLVIEKREPKPVVVKPAKPPSPPLRMLPIFTYLLWALFAVLCLAIFVRLVDGCGFFRWAGLGVQFCEADLGDPDPEFARLVREHKQLLRELTSAQRELIDAPLCGLENPAYISPLPPADPDPFSDSDAPDGDTEDETADESEDSADEGDGSRDAAARHQELNNAVSEAGGTFCDSVEIMALWEGAADVDLRIYCPATTESDDIAGESIIDPFATENCGGIMDLESDGSSESGVNIERVCFDEEALLGDYLAVAVLDSSEGDPQSVRLVFRADETIEEENIEVSPDAESASGLPFVIN